MNEKIKKFRDEHKNELTLVTFASACAITGIVVYTKLCGRGGYAMVKPLAYNTAGDLQVRTVSGRIMIPNVKPTPQA